jgi:hypothetical protein
VTDIEQALAALTVHGIPEADALDALKALSEAGFLVVRPQALLERFIDHALDRKETK